MAQSPRFKWIALLLAVALLTVFPARPAKAQSPTLAPTVQAVLFYRSTCIHCIQLISDILPPILEKYGDSLQIFYVDVSKPEGDALYTAAIERYQIQTIGVPILVVGEQALLGSTNIQDQFPGIIEAALGLGGLGWPDIPGLQAAFSTAGSMQVPPLLPPGSVMSSPPTAVPTAPAGEASVPTLAPAVPVEPPPPAEPAAVSPLERMADNFRRDLPGNSLAAVVLAGMLAALVFGMVAFWKRSTREAAVPSGWAGFIVPLLCALGVGVSAYLAYVELTLAEAMCGPVGDCQAVQASSYARLFGILPVGLAGLGGYLAIGLAWGLARFGRGRWGNWAGLALAGLSLGGLLFSIYLTFLEPFVIGAVCLWCLSSAAIMTLLFLLAVPPGRAAWDQLLNRSNPVANTG